MSLNDEHFMTRSILIDRSHYSLVLLIYTPENIRKHKGVLMFSGGIDTLSLTIIYSRCQCKNYCMCKKNYGLNPSTCIYENTRYLKSIVNNSVTVYDEIISVKESTNVTNTVSINCDDQKV